MTLNRKIEPLFNNIEQINFLKPEKYLLSNGLEVYCLNSGFQELTRIEIIFKAGSWQTLKPLVASFCGSMLLEGTKEKTSSEIADIIDSNGAYLDVQVEKDFANVSLFCLNKYISNTLPLLAEIIFNPSFPKEELEILVNNKKQNFQVNNQKVGFTARNRFMSLLVGKNHPYGRYSDESDYDNISNSDLLDFYTQNYTIENAKILVSGKIEENLVELLDLYFGKTKLKTIKKEEILIYPEISDAKKIHHIQMDGSVQNAIRLGLKTIKRDHTDFHSLKLVNTIFGGYFGSRLMTNIREDKGYTYGIGSGIVSYVHSSFFFISSEVKSENSDDAIQEIMHEIDKLQTIDIKSEELNLVKNYTQGVFQRSFDGVFAQSDRFRELLLWNLDYNYFTDFIKTVKEIDAQEIKRIANTYLTQDSFYILTVGNNKLK